MDLERRQSPEDGVGGRDVWMDVRTDRQTDGQILQDFVPFGAAVQKATVDPSLNVTHLYGTAVYRIAGTQLKNK